LLREKQNIYERKKALLPTLHKFSVPTECPPSPPSPLFGSHTFSRVLPPPHPPSSKKVFVYIFINYVNFSSSNTLLLRRTLK
jgi:hypothetical protein